MTSLHVGRAFRLEMMLQDGLDGYTVCARSINWRWVVDLVQVEMEGRRNGSGAGGLADKGDPNWLAPPRHHPYLAESRQASTTTFPASCPLIRTISSRTATRCIASCAIACIATRTFLTDRGPPLQSGRSLVASTQRRRFTGWPVAW